MNLILGCTCGWMDVYVRVEVMVKAAEWLWFYKEATFFKMWSMA